MSWTLHFLEAEGDLGHWRSRLQAESEAAFVKIAACLAPQAQLPVIDVVLQRVPGFTIPELGLVGHSLRRSCIVITLDPDNAHFEQSLEAGQLTRTLAHEAYHCLRAGAVGFPKSLGDALINEGLADHFDREVNGGDGQIWDRALRADQWSRLLALADRELHAPHYNHELWFYGLARDKISLIPRWAGYTIGYALVAAYLEAVPDARPSRLAGQATASLIAEAWPPLCAHHGVRPAG